MIRLLIALMLAIASPASAAESLTDDEQRMADWIDAHTAEAVALLKETVDIPSGTLNLAGVREVGDVMRRELDALGLETEWVEMPVEMNRAGHLFGRKNGSGKKFLLIGHLDTVFEIDDGIRPFASDGDVARGHGISDM
ncbi:MAG: M20 family peptidase, partial [Gammaproteobacteria bacterium]|nr:M20 family peptidase [Gammaproteobacteria bacterium]